MKYAVISLHNNQYLVKPGSRFDVLGEVGKVGDVVNDIKVLFYQDEQTEVGTPFLDKKIEVKVVALGKTDKVDVFKYKGKSRYRRHTGHRQGNTTLEVASDQAVAKPKAVSTKKAAVAKPKTAKAK